MKIYCPKCRFEPPPDMLWVCECGHQWHTFSTHGICPRCKKMWHETQCPSCHFWSLHDEWYHDDAPARDNVIEEIRKIERDKEKTA